MSYGGIAGNVSPTLAAAAYRGRDLRRSSTPTHDDAGADDDDDDDEDRCQR